MKDVFECWNYISLSFYSFIQAFEVGANPNLAIFFPGPVLHALQSVGPVILPIFFVTVPILFLSSSLMV